MIMREDVKLEPQTAAFQNKVLPSKTLDDNDRTVGAAQPKEGVGITSMKPVGAGKHRGY
jgi:hypothetical protein